MTFLWVVALFWRPDPGSLQVLVLVCLNSRAQVLIILRGSVCVLVHAAKTGVIFTASGPLLPQYVLIKSLEESPTPQLLLDQRQNQTADAVDLFIHAHNFWTKFSKLF